MQTEYDYNNEPELDEYNNPQFSFLDEVGYWGGWFVTVLAVLGLITLILTCNG